MKSTISQRLKKSVSAILAAAMSLSLFTAIPVSADIGKTTYNYDGYSVDYNITNEWDGAQTVELTVSNTGTDSILNWALKYDAEGEISNLWNADLYEQNGDDYVIKNVGWNFEIAPNQSITYGYTLSGNDIALPDSFEIYSKRVDKSDGYDVQYNITKSWDVGVEGNIVITNTSSEPIEAWTLSFDSNFSIDNLWNGRVLENNGTSYTVAAEMWTNPIQPNGSMTIGFVGSKAADVEALLSNFRLTEVVIGEGMPVVPIDPPVEEIEVTANAVYDNENNNVTVSWNTNNPNGTFDILMSEDGENFASVGTVEGVYEFIYTPENDFETLCFKVVQTVGELTAESNVVAVSSDLEAIVITSKAFYDEENDNTIIVEWTSNYPDGIFEVLMSDDGENFISVSKEENTSKYAYTYEEDFNVLYFKVKQTVGLKNAESNTAKIVFYIDWEDLTDTDGDGLSDVYEKYYYETDPLNADTDGDGLPDGYEVYYLGTDPKKADTDDNGISDSDEDFDEDGLSNFEEYQLETDPLSKDTDNDGLSDYDEINTYKTDPLKYDTDGDIISDGDEIALGLNPLSPATNGIPDNEKTFEQTINPDNFILYFVNTEVNPFEVSLKVNAAGVAENNLEAEISGYNYIMKNEAILGVAPAFSYTDGLKVEDVVINFDLDNSVTANTNGKYTGISEEFAGIKRFNVFRYFEDTNMLLPIETFHDVESNRVYANTDELGTYCLIDMEIWFEKLGIEPKVAEPQAMALSDDETELKVSNDDNLDVIFVVYSNSTFYKYLKAELTIAVTDIFNEAEKRGINARVHFVTWTGGMYTNTNTGTHYAENIDDAVLMINNTPVIDVSLEPTIYMLTKAVNGIKNNMTEDFLENSKKYCFVIDSGCNPACSTINGGIDTLKNRGMDFSFVYAPGCTNINNYAALSSNNSIHQMVAGNGRLAFSEFVYNHIFDDPVKIISSAGLVELPEDFGEISVDSEKDYDNDGLLDVQEIYFDVTDKNGSLLVTVNDDGSVELPSFNKCVSVGGTYVEQGLKRFYDEADESILSQLDDIKVLPILADPTSKDGDGDGILDLTEFEIMQKDNLSISLFEFEKQQVNENNLNPIKVDTIIDFCKKIPKPEGKAGGQLTKVNADLRSLIDDDTKKIGVAYTLATEKGIKKYLKNEKPIKYAVMGSHTDATYLELYCTFDQDGNLEKNYLRINANILFSENLSINENGEIKYVKLATEENDNNDNANEESSGGNDEEIIEELTLSNLLKTMSADEIAEKYINRDELINDIKSKWSGCYEGNDYDFFNGMDVNVSVCINILNKELNNNIAENTDNTENVEIDPTEDTSNQNSILIREIYDSNNKLKKKESYLGNYVEIHLFEVEKGNHITNMNLLGNPIVSLFTIRKVDENSEPKFQSKHQLVSACSHEFGHVLGLMDAYGERSKYNYFVEPVSFAEIQYDISKFDTPDAGEIMHRHGKVSTNDIEMLLFAKKNLENQYYVPIGYGEKDGSIVPHEQSKAIRANYIYYAYKDVKNLNIEISNSRYYYFNNGKYKAIKSDTKKSEVLNILCNGDESHRSHYLDYIDSLSISFKNE